MSNSLFFLFSFSFFNHFFYILMISYGAFAFFFSFLNDDGTHPISTHIFWPKLLFFGMVSSCAWFTITNFRKLYRIEGYNGK